MYKLNPNHIDAGETYLVKQGKQLRRIYINHRDGFSQQSYVWHGSDMDNGKRIRISNVERFVEEIDEKRFPWFLTLHFDDEYLFENEIGKLETFWISIREAKTEELLGHIGQSPTDDLAECAKILRRAMDMCRKAAPVGTDLTRIHLWNNGEDFGGYEFGVVDLQFDNWDPVFATPKFISEFLKRAYVEAERIEDGIADQAGD